MRCTLAGICLDWCDCLFAKRRACCGFHSHRRNEKRVITLKSANFLAFMSLGGLLFWLPLVKSNTHCVKCVFKRTCWQGICFLTHRVWLSCVVRNEQGRQKTKKSNQTANFTTFKRQPLASGENRLTRCFHFMLGSERMQKSGIFHKNR